MSSSMTAADFPSADECKPQSMEVDTNEQIQPSNNGLLREKSTHDKILRLLTF